MSTKSIDDKSWVQIFQNQRSTISISLKYSEKTTRPHYFKNLRKSMVFMKKPLKKQAVFCGHLFEFYNKSLRTVIIYQNKFFGSFENHGYKPCELS
jgi:hypothetical protein